MTREMLEIELERIEFASLRANQTINDMCGEYLASPVERKGFVVLRLSRHSAEDLAGWAAAEANHAKTDEEGELLGAACDSIEAHL